MKTDPEKIFEKSANPDAAMAQWKEAGKLPGAAAILPLFGNSRFLVEYLVKNPSVVLDLAVSPYLAKPKETDRMTMDLRILFGKQFVKTVPSAQKIIRDYKYSETARIAVRDLSGSASFEETGGELAALASVSIEFARRAAFHLLTEPRTSLPPSTLPPFTVLGLGKLGGEDLNFSSDIDILYVYGSPMGGRNIEEFFSRASETITRILHERTGEGIAYRVDLNLRPEGKSGPLANSADALTRYYEISSALWERAAFIKARPVAGDGSLGAGILAELDPLVYRKAGDFSAIAELKKMKEKINQELKKSKSPAFNVKLGEGGIREIEFFTTAFQLLYGGREPRLKERNTLKALHNLKELKLVPPEDVDRLRGAYIFLRTVENRLQMADERQLHTLPTDRQELLVLARGAGFSSSEGFAEKLDQTIRFVADCFQKLAP